MPQTAKPNRSGAIASLPPTLGVIPEETIRQMAALIADRFNPEQIILFGSYARGNAGIHSDIDLLIVLESDAPRFEQGIPIRQAISDKWIEPVDLIIRSPKVFQLRRHIPGSLENEATLHGVVLYAKK